MRVLVVAASAGAILSSAGDAQEVKIPTQAEVGLIVSQCNKMIADNGGPRFYSKILRNMFHDCHENNGCAGCVDLTNPDNDGLQNVQAQLKTYHSFIKHIVTKNDFDRTCEAVAIKAAANVQPIHTNAYPTYLPETNGRCPNYKSYQVSYEHAHTSYNSGYPYPATDAYDKINEHLPLYFGRTDKYVNDACNLAPNKRALPAGDEEINGIYERHFKVIPDNISGQRFLKKIYTVALVMGAHSLGSAAMVRSGFNGTWTVQKTRLDNVIFVTARQFGWKHVIHLQAANTKFKWQWELVVEEKLQGRGSVMDQNGDGLMLLNSDLSILYEFDLDERKKSTNACFDNTHNSNCPPQKLVWANIAQSFADDNAHFLHQFFKASTILATYGFTSRDLTHVSWH